MCFPLALRSGLTSRLWCLISEFCRCAGFKFQDDCSRYTLNICEYVSWSLSPRTHSILYRGRWRAEDLTPVLEELLREYGRRCMGCRFRGPTSHPRLQGGIAQVAAGRRAIYVPFLTLRMLTTSSETCGRVSISFCKQAGHSRVNDRRGDQGGAHDDSRFISFKQ